MGGLSINTSVASTLINWAEDDLITKYLQPMRRRLARTLLCAPTVLLVASLAPVGALASDGEGAREALLRRLDLGPGWTVAAAAPRHAAPLTCPRFHPRMTGATETSAAASPSFERTTGGPFVSQTAYVYASRAQERRVWSALARPKLVECVAATLTGASSEGVSFAVTAKGPLALPRLETSAIGYTVSAAATSAEVPTTIFLDAVLFGGGRTISELTVSSFSKQEAAAIARRLARLVARRVAGH